MMAWTSSGSSFSDIAVKPDTSANMTVTRLRSPVSALLVVRILSARCLGVYDSGEAYWRGAAAGAALSVVPHPWQNLLAGGLATPQARQAMPSRAPHSPQNFAPAAFSCAHWG